MTSELKPDQIVKLAMESIPMMGDPEIYRQRIADFKMGFKAAKDALASQLIDVWCADKGGRQIPWAKAVQIVAIVTKQPDAERDRLLHMDDEDGSCDKCGRSA